MPKASDAYPKRNLPGSAEDWGRRVEGVQKDLDDRLLNLEQSVGIHASTLYGQSLINQATSGQVNDNSGTIEITTATPNSPENISVTSNVGYWLDDGTAKSVVIISFDPVTKDINNRDINIEKYELWSSVGGAEKEFNVSSVGTTISYSGWVPGVEVKFALRAKSIYGIASGLSPEFTVTPADPAGIIPKAPTNLAIVSNTGAFNENNRAVSSVEISWDAVTESTADEPITPVEYELWLNEVPYTRTPTNSIKFTVDSESVNLAQVRAKSIVNAWGDLSTPPGLSITGASPSVATRAPSAPTLTTAMSIVTVTWDGTYVSGGTDGAGSVFIEREDGASWVVESAFTVGGSFPLQSTNGDTVNIRLSAYDVLGRLTGRSAEVDIVTVGVDSGDTTAEFDAWIASQAGGSHITKSDTEPTGGVLGDLWFKSSLDGQISNIYIHNGTEFVLYKLIADSITVANSITAAELNVPQIWATSAWIDALSVGAVEADIITTGNITSNSDIILIAQNAKDGKDGADAANDNLTTINSRFVVTPDDVQIQSADPKNRVVISAAGIEIISNNSSVSSWDGTIFSVNSLKVESSADIGGHQMKKYSTGRTTFTQI